ncbi:MAG: FmdB family zinc ribbon protein [Planctomycetota bacterium]
MPLYEYECEQDGTVLELRRPMADADKPVEDPENKGRTFARRPSTFSAQAARASLPQAHCPCGKPGGGCGMTG